MSAPMPTHAAGHADAHAASPGLWALAWRRLRADRVAMAALAVVLLFLLSVLLSATGVVAADWEDEVAVNYAPPSFVGPDPSLAALSQPARPVPPNAFDPLAGELAELKDQLGARAASAGSGPMNVGGA